MRNMKTGLCILLVMFAGCKTVEAGKTHPMMQLLEENYNSNDFENIFQAFSGEMQNTLPLNTTNNFFVNLKSIAGNIVAWQLVNKAQNKYSYKTTFEKGVFIIDLSTNNSSQIDGLIIREYTEDIFPVMERNITDIILPFAGEWYVVWGGDTVELNYHIDNKAQKNAFDFVIMDGNNKTYKTDGLTNDDYYAFGKEIIAPCDGEIVLVVDGIKDNDPGKMNPYYAPGNSVIIRTGNDEYILLGHFKQNSIQVKEQQFVNKGDIIGYCGNSGNSSEPHLHFHIQNTENMMEATGVKSYFDDITVNGNEMRNYSPIKNDKIKNR